VRPHHGNHESEGLRLVPFVGAYIIFKDNARASQAKPKTQRFLSINHQPISQTW